MLELVAPIGIGVVVLFGAMVLFVKMNRNKAAASRKAKEAPAAAEPFRYPTPAEIERQELVARSVKRTAERFDAKHEAELDAKLDELNAPAAK